jgi:hypothetical protein
MRDTFTAIAVVGIVLTGLLNIALLGVATSHSGASDAYAGSMDQAAYDEPESQWDDQ